MKNIVLTRIDDRLIHGQVMTAWLNHCSANEILIVDNELAKDDFMKTMMRALVPRGIGFNTLNTEEASEYLKGDSDKEKVIILVKSPITISKMIAKGVLIETVNLGGMGMAKGRTTLHKNIATSEEENESFKNMIDQKIDVSIQVVPNDSKLNIESYL